MSRVFVASIILMVSLILTQSADAQTDSRFGEYEITGNSVTVNDSYVYLETSPHTLKNSGWITIDFISKQYEGDIDFAIGVDGDVMKPKKAELYNPRNITTEVSYTCDSNGFDEYDTDMNVTYNISDAWFTYQLNPDIFWCWQNRTINGDTTTRLLKTHSFDSTRSNIATKTAVWDEVEFKTWKAVNNDRFGFVYQYAKGMDRWHTLKNFNVEANKTYTMRVYLNVPPKIGTINGKYAIGIKRSSESLSDAFFNSNYYYIDPWFNLSYRNRINISFDNSASSENLTDFPVLVVLNSSRINYTNTQNSGQDIVFVDADDTTVLSHEIELWNESGDSFVWVKVPQVDSGSTGDSIYMYYGCTGCSDTQDAPDVWNDGYLAVYHLSDDDISVNVSDSTGNHLGSSFALTVADDRVAGQAGNAIDFSGSAGGGSEWINLGTWDINSSALTLEAWFTTDLISVCGGRILSKASSGAQQDHYWMMNVCEANFRTRIKAGGSTVTVAETANSLSVGPWFYGVSAYNGSGVNLYLNGTLIATAAKSGAIDLDNTVNVTIARNGDDSDVGNFLDGNVDEIRISNVSRSADWITATWISHRDQMNTYGAEEEAPYNGTESATLYFNNSGSAENLTDFAVLVRLNSTRINYSLTQDAGQDIRFFDDDNITELSYEIEIWNESGFSYVWVKVPQIDAGSTVDYIIMNYSDPTALDSQDVTGTWNSDYIGVWHMAETSGAVLDSTSNDHDGTAIGGLTRTFPGQIGNAYNYDGTNDYVTIADTAALSINETITMTAWMKPDAVGTTGALISKTDGFSDVSYASRVNGEFEAHSCSPGGGSCVQFQEANDGGGGISADWIKYTWTVDFTQTTDADTVKGYKDNINFSVSFINPGGFASINESNDIATNLTFGTWLNFLGNFFNGTIDEIKLSDAIRSFDWVEAEYFTETDTFITYPTLAAPPPVDNAPTVTLVNPADDSTDTDGQVTFNCTATDDINLANISLYTNASGWALNFTNQTTGTWNQSGNTLNFTDGIDILWNCEAFDNASQSAFAAANFTVKISITVGDTCDTCDIDCTEDCTIDTLQNCQSGFNASGAGIVQAQANVNITGAFANISNGCYFNCTSLGCFI